MSRCARPHVPEEEFHAWLDGALSRAQSAEIAEHLLGLPDLPGGPRRRGRDSRPRHRHSRHRPSPVAPSRVSRGTRSPATPESGTALPPAWRCSMLGGWLANQPATLALPTPRLSTMAFVAPAMHAQIPRVGALQGRSLLDPGQLTCRLGHAAPADGHLGEPTTGRAHRPARSRGRRGPGDQLGSRSAGTRRSWPLAAPSRGSTASRSTAVRLQRNGVRHPADVLREAAAPRRPRGLGHRGPRGSRGAGPRGRRGLGTHLLARPPHPPRLHRQRARRRCAPCVWSRWPRRWTRIRWMR